MANKKLRTLRSLRLALSVLAVMLFCLGVVSGILAFSGGKPSAPAPEPPTEAATEAAAEPASLPTGETTGGTEAPDPDSGLVEETVSNSNGIGNADPDGRTPGGNTPDNPLPPAGDAEAVPGDAEAVPGDAEAVPGDAEAVPGDAEAVPGDAEAVPGDAEAVPGDAEAVPGDAEAVPGDAEAVSGNAEAVSGDAEAVPGDAGIIVSSESEPVTESTAAPTETEAPPELPSVPSSSASLWMLIFRLSLCLLVADLAAIGLISLRIRDLKGKQKKNNPDPDIPVIPSSPSPGPVSIGTLHCQGRRQYQQDSLGHSIVLDGRGVLAVVADGMGGLRDGDKVSQQVVLRTLELGGALRPGQENGALLQILKTVNEEVNRFLTPEGLYKSGSTVVQVLVSGDSFQWLSVGDSRIYLYRAGYVNQLNRDHDLLQDWMPEILEGRRDMEASRKDPDGRKLTSFIGMGQLKYVDRSLHPIQLLSGDRIVLLSDGVYGQIPDEQLAEILRRFPDVRQAAQEMDRCVRATQNPHQDNYTALILGF